MKKSRKRTAWEIAEENRAADKAAGYIDPYAHIAEGREPTEAEIDAFVHAHDPPDPATLIDPMHGPYEKLPRDENGRIPAYYFCTKEEILDFGLIEPPRRYRRDGWTPEQMADFIDALATTASVAGACAYVGKSRMSAYRLRNRTDAGHFRAAWDEALQAATAVLADTAYQRAVEGVKKTVWHQGEPVGQETVYNDRLLMFLLRVRDPHRYAPIDELDRAQRLRPVEAGPCIEHQLDLVETSEAQWRHALEPHAEGGESVALQLLQGPPAASDAPALPAAPAAGPDSPETDGETGSHV
jgi:hypothetical protein